MDIQSVHHAYQAYATQTNQAKANSSKEKDETTTKKASGFSNEAAVYEKSSNSTDRASIVAALKADSEAQVNRFLDMVKNTIAGQGNTLASADDIWKFLASGDFTIDEAARKKAEEAISEDGYWGVKQTSQRIVDFAKALSGGDSSKADQLLDAFKKGYKEATKTWGKELPSICSETYDAVVKGFDDWKQGVTAE